MQIHSPSPERLGVIGTEPKVLVDSEIRDSLEGPLDCLNRWKATTGEDMGLDEITSVLRSFEAIWFNHDRLLRRQLHRDRGRADVHM
jgi:hypothetical protein